MDGQFVANDSNRFIVVDRNSSKPSSKGFYVYNEIAGVHETFGIWLHETIEPDDAIRRLIERYAGLLRVD